MKIKLIAISLLLLIVACTIQGDYLPVKSEFYIIKNKSIIFQNSDLTINVSGTGDQTRSLQSYINI